MGTERDFVVKKGLKVAEGITLGGHTFDDIDIGSEFVDTDDHLMSSGAIKEKIEGYSYVTANQNTTGSAGTVTSIGNLTGDVTSSNRATTIANNAVSLAKMAGITRGSIIIGNASGDPAALAIGSNDYVLTSDGTDIAWEAAAGGATALNGLSDVIASGNGNLWISPGDTPSHGILSSAIQNISIGKLAGDAITEGDRNIALGTAAGSGITTGEGNISIGDFAQYTQTTGSANVVVGRQALFGNGVKNNNSGFGHNALYATTTGSNNLALGFEAGNNITSGSHNVVIGNADVASATGDSQLSISSGNGGVTWITGNSTGGINSKAEVVAVSGNTTLTLAQTGAYIYWTNGSLTLPASGTVGTQYTIFNNTGGSATVQLNGSNCSIVSGWPSVTATGDHEAVTFVCVTANNWVQIG